MILATSSPLFRREGGAGDARDAGDAYTADESSPKPKQRRADAVGLLAERALAAGFGGSELRDAGGRRHDHRRVGALDDSDATARGSRRESASDIGERAGDAGERASDIGERAGDVGKSGRGMGAPGGGPGGSCDGSDPGQRDKPRVESGTRAERYQVMVHCDAATLGAEGEPGRSDLDGIRVSAETSRRMACDAAVVAMVHAKDGSLLNVGRRTRTIPPHIRRALEERDRGCRFPGCGCRFTEAHHVKHWADGGETSLRNTLLLCRRHHRAVHEGRAKVSVNSDGTVLFFTPKGKMLADAPRKPEAARRRGREEMVAPSTGSGGGLAGQSASLLPPVPTVHPGAPREGGYPTLLNGAALYRDSDIPWKIEAAAREALEESLG